MVLWLVQNTDVVFRVLKRPLGSTVKTPPLLKHLRLPEPVLIDTEAILNKLTGDDDKSKIERLQILKIWAEKPKHPIIS